MSPRRIPLPLRTLLIIYCNIYTDFSPIYSQQEGGKPLSISLCTRWWRLARPGPSGIAPVPSPSPSPQPSDGKKLPDQTQGVRRQRCRHQDRVLRSVRVGPAHHQRRLGRRAAAAVRGPRDRWQGHQGRPQGQDHQGGRPRRRRRPDLGLLEVPTVQERQ
jgi:hypothetical protein